MSRTTAQVAVEAVIADPYDYEMSTMRTVLEDAVSIGVASLYVDMLRDVIETRETEGN